MPTDTISESIMDFPQPTAATENVSAPCSKTIIGEKSTDTETQAKDVRGSAHMEEQNGETSPYLIMSQDVGQLQKQHEPLGSGLIVPEGNPGEATIVESPSSPRTSSDEHSVPPALSSSAPTDVEKSPAVEAEASTFADIRTVIRQDLLAGRFSISEVKGQHVDVEPPPPGTYKFPPALLPCHTSLHRQRFSRSHLLPDRNLPFNIQIMEHVKDWAELASTIRDDARRKEVLDRVFEILQNVWFEALRIGYDPGTVPENGVRSRSKAVSQVKKSADPGRPPTMMRARPRKSLDPMKVPIFMSKSYKNAELWAVTAGELKEAGVSEDRIRQRAAGDLSMGDEIFQEILHECEGVISKEDWYAVAESTELNPKGRNLFLYALFEVQWSRMSMEKLRRLHDDFPTRQQKENTRKRIDAEKERHDLFLALALEVNERISSSRSPSPTPNQGEGNEATEAEQNLDQDSAQSGQTETFLGLSEAIINEPSWGSMIDLFERSGFSHENLTTDPISEQQSDNLNLAKHALSDLLEHVHERQLLSDAANRTDDFEKNLEICAQIGEIEKEIAERKDALRGLLQTLRGTNVAADSATEGEDVEMDETALSTTEGHTPGPSTSLKRPLSPELAEDENHPPPPKKPKSLPLQHPDASSEVSVATKPSMAMPDKPRPDIPATSPLPQHDESFAPSDQMQSNKPSCPVALRVPGGFNPAEFSSETVFSYKGFKYRYTRSSTLAQRRSMDEALHDYVRYWTRPRKGFDLTWRFGRYEAIADPHDEERATVIHGFWDEKDGSKVKGVEWFYEGDGEWQPPAEAENEQPMAQDALYDDDQEEAAEEGNEEEEADDDDGEDEPAPPVAKISLVNKHLQNVIRLRRADGKRKTRDSVKKAKEKSKKRGLAGSHSAPSPLSQAVSTTRSASGSPSSATRRARKPRRKPGDAAPDDEYCPSD